jgi:hypothetical protein
MSYVYLRIIHNHLRIYATILILLLLRTLSYCQTIKRFGGETAKQFASRIKPDSSELTHSVLETKWNSDSVIIAFYKQGYKLPKERDSDQQTYLRIIATIFIQSDNNHYRKFLIDTVDNEGGEPKIESVFFANVDKDTAKELIIIASWEQSHYDMSGTLYGTFIYDDIPDYDKMKLNFMNDLSDKFSGGCECSWRDGTNKKSKFKTASDIKRHLIKLGFKQ